MLWCRRLFIQCYAVLLLISILYKICGKGLLNGSIEINLDPTLEDGLFIVANRNYPVKACCGKFIGIENELFSGVSDW